MTDTLTRLGGALADRYRLERELGQGGMATVYLAEDLKHGRKVAIKVLHPELSAVIGGERFLAEIKVTANLQHPHILGLIDSGEADKLLYYVMPYVSGESLRARLDREKQLPVDEALRLAKEVASALDYAHRQGVVHRDVKPENILLQDGSALVADFGIALAVQQAGGGRMTQTGMSLGTPHYMAPEQAMGEREITPRADVYALGAMTYEMLAGEPPFTGPNSQAIVAKVLTEPPALLRPKRATVTPAVEAAVLTALQKLPADRWASAKEFSDALEGIGRAPRHAQTVAIAATRPGAGRASRVVVTGLAIGLLGTAALAARGWLRPAPPKRVLRYEILTQGTFGGPLAIAPDGSAILASGRGDSLNPAQYVWVLRRDELTPTRVPGVEGLPAISPDGRELVAVSSDGRIVRSGLAGSASQVLTDSARQFPAWWGKDGFVYYTDLEWGLSRRPAAGGPAEKLTRAAADSNELHGRPVLLPSGKAVLFTAWRALVGSEAHRVMVLDLRTRKVTELARGFVPLYGHGQLLYATGDGSLVRAPFDPEKLAVTGSAEVVATGLRTNAGYANIALSDDGTLVYQLGARTRQQQVLSIVSRSGASRPLLGTPRGSYLSVRLSPAGDHVALDLAGGGTDGGDIYVLRLGDSVPVRLTFKGINTYPTWSPDGRRIAYSSIDSAGRRPMWQAADGSDRPEPLRARGKDLYEIEFARDGHLIARTGNASGGADLNLVRYAVEGDSAEPFAASPKAWEFAQRLSPDGHWLAYASTETGHTEVFVRPYPDPGSGAQWQVSDDGGTEPVWARSGHELFYKSQGSLVAAEIRTTPGFGVGARRRLFPITSYLNNQFHARYDVLPGDTAFVFIGSPLGPQDIHTVVVENWFAELERQPSR